MDRSQRKALVSVAVSLVLAGAAAGGARAESAATATVGQPVSERDDGGGAALRLALPLPGVGTTVEVSGASFAYQRGLSQRVGSAALQARRLQLGLRLGVLDLDGQSTPERRIRIDATPTVALDLVGGRRSRPALYVRLDLPLALQIVTPKNGQPAGATAAALGVQVALGVRAAVSRALTVSVEAGPAVQLASIDPARLPGGRSLYGAVLASYAP